MFSLNPFLKVDQVLDKICPSTCYQPISTYGDQLTIDIVKPTNTFMHAPIPFHRARPIKLVASLGSHMRQVTT